MDKQGRGTKRVGIYGSRLAISAIGASLQGKPEFEVQQIDGLLTELVDKLDAVPPDVILFDLAGTQPHFAIPLLHTHPTILVIGIDLANEKMLVLSGKEFRLLTVEDLVEVMGNQVGRRELVRAGADTYDGQMEQEKRPV
jgi:hypothetical protein